MQWFPPREWPYINAVNLVCGNISLAVTFAVTAPLYYHFGSSWGATLSFYGVLEIGVAILWTVFGRENKGEPAAAAAPSSYHEPTRRLDVLKRADVQLAAVGIFGGVWTTSLHGAFMPQFFHAHRGLTLTQAGTLGPSQRSRRSRARYWAELPRAWWDGAGRLPGRSDCSAFAARWERC
jgi:hypothetical protein